MTPNWPPWSATFIARVQKYKFSNVVISIDYHQQYEIDCFSPPHACQHSLFVFFLGSININSGATIFLIFPHWALGKALELERLFETWWSGDLQRYVNVRLSIIRLPCYVSHQVNMFQFTTLSVVLSCNFNGKSHETTTWASHDSWFFVIHVAVCFVVYGVLLHTYAVVEWMDEVTLNMARFQKKIIFDFSNHASH